MEEENNWFAKKILCLARETEVLEFDLIKWTFRSSYSFFSAEKMLFIKG